MKRTFFTPMAALMILTTSVVVAQSQEPYNPSSPGASPDSLTSTPRTPTSVTPMQRDSLQGDTQNRTPGTTGATPYQPMTPSEGTTTPGTTRGGTSGAYATTGRHRNLPKTAGPSPFVGMSGLVTLVTGMLLMRQRRKP